MRLIQLLLIGISFVVFGACSSTLNTTGKIDESPDIKNIAIVCTSPENVIKFSNELCLNLKQELVRKSVGAEFRIINEMDPSSNSSETTITTNQRSDIIMTISHERVTLTYGKPSNTLLNIKLLDPKNDKYIWGAKMYTQGSNVTGPGNPEKIAAEIIERLKVETRD